MIVDARTIPTDSVIETDLCIIGAGAAGITIASECIDQPFQIVLAESGGLEYEEQTQALYAAENVGLEYHPQWARLRYFGGSTNHWGGACRPLDPIDFEERDWVPNSGWPFGYEELRPYYARANETCRLGPFAYSFEALEGRKFPSYLPGLEFLAAKGFRFSSTVFATEYLKDLERADNVKALLYANAVDIDTDDQQSSITKIRIACLSRTAFDIAARVFILATGGIENARLLLVSSNRYGRGLGNQHDLVGRYFMDHACFNSGVLALRHNPALENLYSTVKPRYHEGVPFEYAMSLCDAIQRSHGLFNHGVWLIPWDSANTGEDGRNVFGFAPYFEEQGFVEFFRLTNYHEITPNPESRVSLSTKRDALGVNQIKLRWLVDAAEKENSRKIQRTIAKEMGRAGIGRFRSELDDKGGDVWPGSCSHHMGTTRMHRDPKKGVVDADCRVHGLSNLFVAGSSVFPTSGFANPTLTLVALAHRLSDHVKRLLT
jgi:choline dehydrogenase-like flavoprotein